MMILLWHWKTIIPKCCSALICALTSFRTLYSISLAYLISVTTNRCHIIATKYPARHPGQRWTLGCWWRPAGNLSLRPSRPPPLSGSLPSSGMCDSFPALLPPNHRSVREQCGADPRWHSCGIVCSPGWCVTVVPLASSIVEPHSVQSAGVGFFLCAVI